MRGNSGWHVIRSHGRTRDSARKILSRGDGRNFMSYNGRSGGVHTTQRRLHDGSASRGAAPVLGNE